MDLQIILIRCCVCKKRLKIKLHCKGGELPKVLELDFDKIEARCKKNAKSFKKPSMVSDSYCKPCGKKAMKIARAKRDEANGEDKKAKE